MEKIKKMTKTIRRNHPEKNSLSNLKRRLRKKRVIRKKGVKRSVIMQKET